MTHTISTTDRTDDVYGQVWIDGVTNAARARRPACAPSWASGRTAPIRPATPAGVGRRGVQRRRRQQRRVRGLAAARHASARSTMPTATPSPTAATGSTPTSTASATATARPRPGALTVSPAATRRRRRPRPGSTSWPPRRPGRARLGRRRGRPDAVRLRGPARRRAGRAVHAPRRRPRPRRCTDTPGRGRRDVLLRRARGRHVVQPLRPVGRGQATAELRTVTLVVQRDRAGDHRRDRPVVHIAGFLDRLDGGLPEWDAGGVALTRVDATHWTITFTGKEATQLEYKYTLGDWDYVEKDAGLRRDRQPPAHAELRLERDAGGQRHRAQLAERGALRQLSGRAAGSWCRIGPSGHPARPSARSRLPG